jgi:hypothetical protein
MRKIITSAAVAAAAAAVLGGTGMAVAGTHAAATGTEHFQLMSTSSFNRSSVVAYGAFTAGGAGVSGAHNTETVTFANGSFTLVHKSTGGHQQFNPTTCLLTGRQTATYTIGNGTGAYAGISGSGKAVLTILAVAARNSTGACSQALPPAAIHVVINASGPVTLP